MGLGGWAIPTETSHIVMTDAVQLNASQESKDTNVIVMQLYNTYIQPNAERKNPNMLLSEKQCTKLIYFYVKLMGYNSFSQKGLM